MRKCSKCGKTYDNTWSVCLNCGEKLIICEPVAGEKEEPSLTTKKEDLRQYFQNIFNKFDLGKSAFSWNWFAAIFQPLWYMVKGMWPKVFLYWAIWWALEKTLMSFDLITISSFLWIVAFIYFGALGNYDYYLYKRKDEFFWPKMPYKKLKMPFWIVMAGLILYGTVFYGITVTKAIAIYTKDVKPGAIESFVDEGIKFSNIPNQWVIYKNPPERFSLKISRPVKPKFSETLKLTALPGTKFMGYIIEGQDKEKIYKGLIALIEHKPLFNAKFKSIHDDAVINKAKLEASANEMPHYLRWLNRWISTKPSDIKYVEFSGYKWGWIRTDMTLNVLDYKSTFYTNVYWTVADGKAIYVKSEAFEPYKDIVKTQVESFLSSFSVQK